MKATKRARAIQPTLIRQITNLASADSLHLGLGQPDLPVSPAVTEALSRTTTTPYTPNRGRPDLVSKIGERYAADAGIIVTCGVQESLAVALLGLVEGGSVLVPDPGFPAYPNLVRAAGAQPVPYALAPDFGLDPEQVRAAWREDTVAIVLNSPSNPTGGVASAEAVEEVVRWCERKNAFWISDEIYEEFVWHGAHHSPASYGSNGVVASGLSKSHAAMGLRIGWLAGPTDVIDSLVPLHQHLVTCAPEPSQRAALVMLDEHEQRVHELRAVFESRREMTRSAIGEWGVPVPECAGAFYAFVDLRSVLPDGYTSLQFARALLAQADVVTIPGSGFGERGEGFLRLAYTVDETILEEALGRVGEFLQNRSFG